MPPRVGTLEPSGDDATCTAAAVNESIGEEGMLPSAKRAPEAVSAKQVGAATGKKARIRRPWYRNGGMKVNIFLLAYVNTFGPIFHLATYVDDSTSVWGELSMRQLFLTALAVIIIVPPYIWRYRSIYYCSLIVPAYFTSLLLCFLWQPGTSNVPPALLILVSIALSCVKINICMSVCLHRYAAHSAFACGPGTRLFLSILGCLANQGGPIWWGSQHRSHHKNCDLKRDPHSAKIMGVEAAFSFFERKYKVFEEFLPRHLDGAEYLRALDTWAFGVVSIELILAYALGGPTALFIAYTSGWLAQTITLWFNLVYHPQDGEDHHHHHETDETQVDKKALRQKCLASDASTFGIMRVVLPPGYAMAGRFPPFHVFNVLCALFLLIVQEGEHAHHHEFAQLAQRSPHDIAYWGFIYPLEKLGLVWNVHKLPSSAPNKKQC